MKTEGKGTPVYQSYFSKGSVVSKNQKILRSKRPSISVLRDVTMILNVEYNKEAPTDLIYCIRDTGKLFTTIQNLDRRSFLWLSLPPSW